MLYLPPQIHFLIGGERVTCHGSKLANALGRTRLTNFSFARDQVVHLETAANLYASQPLYVNKQAIEVR